jgi:hypothetical protein
MLNRARHLYSYSLHTPNEFVRGGKRRWRTSSESSRPIAVFCVGWLPAHWW